MGFQFHRRVSLGKNGFLNLSSSGVSASQRTSWGSFGTRGFSIRTGIPGLSYRKRYKKGDPTAIIVILLMVIVPLVWALLQVVVSVVLLIARIVVIAALWILVVLWELTKWCALTASDFAKYCFGQLRRRRLERQRPEQLTASRHAIAVEVSHDEESSKSSQE